jgi:hypothetical protein
LQELRITEREKLLARLGRLAGQLSATDIDHVVVGWLNLHDGIWWIALYGEWDEAAPFFEYASHQLSQVVQECVEDNCGLSAEHSYSCFTSNLGLFLSKALFRRRLDDLAPFDLALCHLERCAASPDDSDIERRTPSLLLTSGLVALAGVWHRPVPDGLKSTSRNARVSQRFAGLQEAVCGVIVDPSEKRLAEFRSEYKRVISVAEYRAGLVRGLQLQSVLLFSTIAQGGDLVAGAERMFLQ